MNDEGNFSNRTIGIISNYGNHHPFGFQLKHLLTLGIQNFVYIGPLACLDEPYEAMELMWSVSMKMVYGKSETRDPSSGRRVFSGPRTFPAGNIELHWHGVLFRYFLPLEDESEFAALWELRLHRPGFRVEDTFASLFRGSDARIAVIGSGLDFEHWGCDVDMKNIKLKQEDISSYPFSVVELDPNCKHIIVHPTSRAHCCSVLDSVQNRLIIYAVTSG
jgi:hypothetical protein